MKTSVILSRTATNLTIGRRLEDGEDLPELSHVSVVRRQLVDEQGLRVERLEGGVRRVEPVALQGVSQVRKSRRSHSPAVQKVPGLRRRIAGDVLDEAVAFAVG